MNPFKVGDRVVPDPEWLESLPSMMRREYASMTPGLVTEVEYEIIRVIWPDGDAWFYCKNLAPAPTPASDVEGALKALHELYEASQRDEYTDTDCGASSTRPVACLGKPLPEGGL